MAWWIFQHLVTTAALAMLVALVCRVTRFGPVTRHALWVLVLIKFVTPPVVAGPWTLPDPLGLSASAHDAPLSREIGRDAAAPPLTDDGAGDSTIEASFNRVDTGGARAPVESRARVWAWIVGVWAAGSVLLALVEGIRLFRLARRTRAAVAAPQDLVDRVAHHATRLGQSPVPIVIVDGARAPSVWGLFRPRILWPATLGHQVPEAGTDGLIVHELAHVKRRDHLVGWIELAGGILWWWNPLFWSVRAALREQAELACDAWVISALPDGRRAYAESLLALASEVPHPVASSMAVVGISATTRRALERRLVMIMKGHASLKLTFVGVCSLVMVAAATLPTWAASSQVVQPPAAAPAPAPPSLVPPQVASAPATAAAPARRAATPPTMRPSAPRPTVAQRPSVAAPTVVPPSALSRPRGRGQFMPNLPEAAQALAMAFEKDQQTYQDELRQKLESRRATFRTELERLQDELTKAGKLDEAVAVRNYLRMATSTGTRPMTAGRGGRGGGGR